MLAKWSIFTCDGVDVNSNGRLIVNGHYVFPTVVISQPNYGWETTLVIWSEPQSDEENKNLKNKELDVIISNITNNNSESYTMKLKRSLPDCDGPKINCANFYGENAIRLNAGKVTIEVRLDGMTLEKIEYDVPMGEAPEFKESQQEFTEKVMGNEFGVIDVAKLISRATKSITLVDPYLGPQELIGFLSRIEDSNIEIKVLTYNKASEYTTEIVNLKNTYPNLIVKKSKKIHDRFIFVNEDVYAFGYSLKDLQNRYSYASKISSYQVHSDVTNMIRNVWNDSNTREI